MSTDQNGSNLSFSTELGQEYRQLRRHSFQEGTSKSLAIPYTVTYINSQIKKKGYSKLVDFGCFDGQMLGIVRDTIQSDKLELTGIDNNSNILEIARKGLPSAKFLDKDLTKPLDLKDKYTIALCINTLHEIFSACKQDRTIDFHDGKGLVSNVLKSIHNSLEEDGYLVLFDGVEYSSPETEVSFEALSKEVKDQFYKFAEEYKAVEIKYTEKDNIITTSKRDFSRFITKLRFIDNIVWEIERTESYQYFSKEEYMQIAESIGFLVNGYALLSPNIGLWSKQVRILSPKTNFPFEHLLLILQKVTKS